ncbi:hypothetical protein [uncultured Maribacter sp.]|uniref:hypothetical protein n=1 Tax=uncultured Maribacter sp. TaxID=431308 RepID=UPI00260E1E48|nr:hypothetical protein [uncultured Maribacter sp.]
MKFYNNYLAEYTKGLTGYTAIGIIGQSCLGSIAAMYVLKGGVAISEMTQLFLVIVFCMGYNAAILAQLKPKTSFNLLIASILCSIIILIVNLT